MLCLFPAFLSRGSLRQRLESDHFSRNLYLFISFFQESERQNKLMRSALRVVIDRVKSMHGELTELKRKAANRTPDNDVPDSAEDFLPENNNPAPVITREIGGRQFPMNSKADMERFCVFWNKCHKAWTDKKEKKNFTSDDEAEAALGSPQHYRLVSVFKCVAAE